MQVRHAVWGTLLLGAAAMLATDALPGAEGFAQGPKVGLIMAFATMGLLVVGVPFTNWVIHKTTRPEDYQGGCPVGRVCPQCDAFNYYPRAACRLCATDLAAVPDAARQAL